MVVELVNAVLQVGAPRDGLSTAADVAVVVVAVAVVAMAIVVMMLSLRLYRTVAELRRSARLTLGPVSERARRVSDNVEFITQALRTDVERLTSSVRDLTDRLHQASERMEERIEDFNALMEVVQTEAEEIFIDTASTVRGVKEGARTIAAPEPGRAQGETAPARGRAAVGTPERTPGAASDL